MIREFIHGDPKAQPRPKAARCRGGIRIYTPPSADAWKALVRIGFAKHKGTFVKGEALAIHLQFNFKRAAGNLKKSGELRKGVNFYHVQKPDFDNLAKAVVDAIGDAGVWHDDCQIVSSRIGKKWSVDNEDVGCGIIIKKVEE
ncbi:RusA family crossover junction endodeoxyribonuclease [Akkermansiaceae bacterium]|nr:RusA family crossover junction endodeoxyribonuclease [Akkermansiaceae bacterium]